MRLIINFLFVAMIAVLLASCSEKICGVSDVNTINGNGNTPLHQAIVDNNTSQVECLINAGANVDAIDAEGYTPIHITVGQGNSKLLQTLIEAEANVNAFDAEGYTPLYYAAWFDNLEIANILSDAGAKIDAKNKDRKKWIKLQRAKFYLWLRQSSTPGMIIRYGRFLIGQFPWMRAIRIGKYTVKWARDAVSPVKP